MTLEHRQQAKHPDTHTIRVCAKAQVPNGPQMDRRRVVEHERTGNNGRRSMSCRAAGQGCSSGRLANYPESHGSQEAGESAGELELGPEADWDQKQEDRVLDWLG